MEKQKRPPPPPKRIVPAGMPQQSQSEVKVEIRAGNDRNGLIGCGIMLLVLGGLFWWKPIVGASVVVIFVLLGIFGKTPGLR